MLDKKKFLLVGSYAESLLNFRGPLLSAIRAQNIEVHVGAPNLPAESPVRRRLEELGVNVHEIILQRTSMNPFGDVVAVLSLVHLIVKIKPTFFMGYTIKPVIYGNLAAWIARVPNRFALITGLGFTFQNNGKFRSVFKQLVQLLYKFSLRLVDKVFFQNADDEALFHRLALINPVHTLSTVVNGSGVDLDAFGVLPLPSGAKFLMIARLLGDKGVREYLEAASIVHERYPDVNFGLVGWVDQNPDSLTEAELQKWIDLGIVSFYGHVDDVRPVIGIYSIFVLPSYREGTPRSVLEAMSLGRPIITTDAPGCRETVISGENGFLVRVKSVDDLVNTMITFITQSDLIIPMGRRSRQLAEKKYDVNQVNQHMISEMGIKS